MPKLKTFEQAKRTVYRFLKLRLQSELEIRIKLKQREFDSQVVDQTLDYFKKHKLVDDLMFARMWTASRLNRPFGVNRIRFELKHKGIAAEVIEELFKDSDYAQQEYKLVLELAKRRKELMCNIAQEKIKPRIYAQLLRKGFNQSTVLKVLKQL